MGDLFDLVIIGGGINGAALADLAATNGCRTALLEKSDFGSGVTSRSTRLIHGGLRYLEHGQVGVVRESLREREALLEDFPFQVRPLPFVVPVYEGDSRGALWIRLGLEAYHWIGHSRLLEKHRQLSAVEALAAEPGLRPQGLRAGFLYYDCQATFPERLALEMALTAEEHGAEVRNHTAATELMMEHSRVIGVGASDGREFRARLVINAAGPWADDVRRLLAVQGGARHEQPLLTLLSGAHIVTAGFPGAPAHAVYHEATSDHRPFFVIPWEGLWLIGTTETPYRGEPGGAAPMETEIDYLLRETNLLFPDAGLERGSILYSYAGVRPLLFDPAHPAQAVSREHALYDHEEEEGITGMITLLGGKLTTARAFAMQALTLAARKLGRLRPVRRPRAPWDRNGVPTRLAQIYGRRAPDVVALARNRPELDCPIGAAETTAAEIVHAVTREKAETLGDILLRRTGLAFDRRFTPECAAQAARVAAPLLGWDEAGVRTALGECERELDHTLHRGQRS